MESLATTVHVVGNATITPPPCVLPSLVPECQTSWEIYGKARALSYGYPSYDPYPDCAYNDTVTGSCASAWATYQSSDSAYWHAFDASPTCTQASITGSICSAMISSYLSVSAVYAAPDDGRIGDPSQVVAPGCTVGCQTCRINGGTVQLIYWSPRTINPSNNRTSNATSLVTAVGLGTTFTSPTVYISFDSLYASNSCGTFGQKYSNTIIPVDPADLSSIWGYQRYNALGWTTSFNFTDLYVTPVPNSIYQSQPRCAKSWFDLWPTYPANWSCPRTLPYLPILEVPKEVLNIDPAWSSCKGWV